MRVKYLTQEHNAVHQPGLEPGPFDPESSALTIRPPRLPYKFWVYHGVKTSEIFLCFGVSVCLLFIVSKSFGFYTKDEPKFYMLLPALSVKRVSGYHIERN